MCKKTILFIIFWIKWRTSMNASMHLNSTRKRYDKFYVVTSAFHHNRARKLLELIDPSREYTWVLGQEELLDAAYWKNNHIKKM